MHFGARREFLYDPAVFKLRNVTTALKIYAEWVRKHSAVPYPKFFEVDRSNSAVDPLWHQPMGPRTTFSREIEIPAIHKFDKPKWKRTAVGITPSRVDQFLLAHNILSDVDYFPQIGDLVYKNGYRLTITDVCMDPECYWQQTNQWLGIYVVAVIAPDGDARPVENPGVSVPAERRSRLPDA